MTREQELAAAFAQWWEDIRPAMSHFTMPESIDFKNIRDAKRSLRSQAEQATDDLPSFSRLLEILSNTSRFRISEKDIVHVSMVGQSINARSMLLDMLAKVAIGKESIDMVNSEHLCFRFESILAEDDVEHEIISPLYGFSSDLTEIELTQSISIRRISDDMLLDLSPVISSDNHPFSTPYPTHAIVSSGTTRKFMYSASLDSFPDAADMNAEISRIYARRDAVDLTASLLSVVADWPFYYTISSERIPGPFGWTLIAGLRPWTAGRHVDRFQFNEENAERARLFCSVALAKGFENYHFISLAIRRFVNSRNHLDYEAKAIDLSIVSEALFLSDTANPSERGELSFRLSLRMAKYLASSSDEQKEIFALSRKLYNLRSRVVHGSAAPDYGELVDTCTRAGALVRRSLEKAILGIPSGATKKGSLVASWHDLMFA